MNAPRIDPVRQAAHGGPALEQPEEVVAQLRDRERTFGRPVPVVATLGALRVLKKAGAAAKSGEGASRSDAVAPAPTPKPEENDNA